MSDTYEYRRNRGRSRIRTPTGSLFCARCNAVDLCREPDYIVNSRRLNTCDASGTAFYYFCVPCGLEVHFQFAEHQRHVRLFETQKEWAEVHALIQQHEQIGEIVPDRLRTRRKALTECIRRIARGEAA